jgi:Uma2 family endonuclease
MHEKAHGPRPHRWSLAEYYKLAELGFFKGVRVELINGVIYEMPAIEWPHVVATSRTGDALRAAFRGRADVLENAPFPFSNSEPVPDLRVLPGRASDYADNPSCAALVVEVSDSTLEFDRTYKAELYATAGVQDYWVLDLNGRVLHLFRDPQPLPAALNATAYRAHLTFGTGDSVSPLAAPHAVIAVADLIK